MSNYKRKRPRTKGRSEGQFPGGCPAWWNIMHHTRPRRRESHRLCHEIKQGEDADTVVFPLGNSRPTVYYW